MNKIRDNIFKTLQKLKKWKQDRYAKKIAQKIAEDIKKIISEEKPHV